VLTPLEAVFFDLDGLLADTEDLHVFAYRTIAQRLGIELSQEYIFSFIGAPTSVNMRKIMRDFHIPEEQFEELLLLRYQSYLDNVNHTPLFLMKGAIECIRYVRAIGLKTALVTSSKQEHSQAVFNNILQNSFLHTSLATFFDCKVFGDDIKNLKPAPDIYIEAIRRLHSSPERGIALEDSEAGVISAKGAGLQVIAVPGLHTRGQNFKMADHILSSLEDIAKLGLFQ
jgi:HAD superfamily hydrolase (TIGR01509 family)